jgi:putative resolvase
MIERMSEYLGVKLAEWARADGVRPQSAFRWFRHGTMPDLARHLPLGTILVEARENPPADRVVLSMRVSAHDRRADLDRQIAPLTAWATGQGTVVAEVDCESRLGHDRHRSKLRRLLAGPQVRVIVVEHRHRWPASGSSTWRRRFRPWPPSRGRRSPPDQRQPGAGT